MENNKNGNFCQEINIEKEDSFERLRQSDTLIGFLLRGEERWKERNKIEDNPFIKANFSLKALKRIDLVVNIFDFILKTIIVYQTFIVLKSTYLICVNRIVLDYNSFLLYLDKIKSQNLDEFIYLFLLFFISYIICWIPLSIEQAIKELEKRSIKETK